MGPKSEMHRRLSRLPRGVVLQFGFHKNYAIEMKKLRSCGHKIVAADEEGLVTLSPEHYKRYRVSSKTLEQCDKCYCWGEIHAQMVREVDFLSGPEVTCYWQPAHGFAEARLSRFG